MTPWLGGALVAALAGAPHCLGMCGSFACAVGERPAHQGAYHLGRIATYAALGAATGALGHVIPGPEWVPSAVAAVLLVGFAAALAGLLPEPKVALPGLARAGAALAGRTDLPSRLLLGVVNGLLPCGLVYATLSLAVASGGAASGALVMTVFGLGTAPVLLVATWGLRRALARSLHARRALAAVVLVAGLWSLGFRTGLWSAEARESDLPACHAEP